MCPLPPHLGHHIPPHRYPELHHVARDGEEKEQ